MSPCTEAGMPWKASAAGTKAPRPWMYTQLPDRRAGGSACAPERPPRHCFLRRRRHTRSSQS
eukprot:5248855-Pyramimonas_sp.AAC.1